MEGQRASPYGGGSTLEAKELPVPENYPRIGVSIGMSSKHGNISRVSSTLAGYIQVDKKVVGLTNNCVLFGDRPSHAFPTEHEASAGVSYTVIQPAEWDLKEAIDNLKDDRKELLELKEKTMPTNLKWLI